MLSYSLALASLYLVAGALDDRLGRRRMFIVGTAGFALASSLGGVAPGAAVLVLARILQGAAGALLTTGSLSLLRSTFGHESGRAIGIWATGTGAVGLGGPPLGGALVEWASWRWIFFLNVPLAIVAIALAWVAHRGTTHPEAPSSRLDVLGAGLVAVGIGSLTYGLVQGGEQGFGDVAWAFLLAGACLGVFIVRERRTRDPLLPFSLFRSRDFALVNVATFLIYSAVAGSTFFLVLFLQSVVGYTPFETGLLLLPSTAVILLLAARFGRLSDRYGPRTFLVVGPMVMAAGMLLWLRVDESLGRSSPRPRSLRPRALADRRTHHLRRTHDCTRALLGSRGRNQLDLLAPRQPPRDRHSGRSSLARVRRSNRRS
jgi:EmrB/QacA subfamily drug resistance transporter